ncbi:TatD family hydrolase [Bartonella sp. DGB1]|uniref:TatD family hydrolase n=1 Tax=Bartonella sp. DGB1 TaxID=3239807 RepID=UPI003525DE90
MLIDSHCHLDFAQFNEDIEEVIKRAKDKKISKMINICCKVKKIKQIFNLIDKYPQLYCSVGTHPCSAQEEIDIEEEEIIKLAQHPKVVALGEVGLDYYHDLSYIEEQKIVFNRYINLSRKLNLPLIIHSRNCDEDMIDILQDSYKKEAFNFVLHSFSSGEKLAEAALSLGGYFSFSGIITFKNAQAVRDIAKEIPINRILVETDAPYLAPVPYRGKRNEPAFVTETAMTLANIFGLTYLEFCNITTNNNYTIFPKLR